MPPKDLKLLLVTLCLLFSSLAQAREITLFDREGAAIAYIDTKEELTIFLWNGNPVAYLEKSSIYGFNGQHLGWFKEGIVRDHQGNGVGFIEGAVNKLTKLEPLKSLQKLTPLRSLEQLDPLEPIFRDGWSSIGDDGNVLLALRYGVKSLEFAKGKNAIEVSDLNELVLTLEKLKQATEAGEFDSQLMTVASRIDKQPSGAKKNAK